MSNIWFCSDLHFGHKNVQNFRKQFISEADNRHAIKKDWMDNVTKRDVVYVLGDAAFTMDSVEEFRWLSGRKILVRGNHDKLDTTAYLKHFEQVYGIIKYQEFWLSHAPIHPDELRGKVNLHGHTHFHNIDDPRYFNCCPENLWPKYNRCLVSLDEIRKHYEEMVRV